MTDSAALPWTALPSRRALHDRIDRLPLSADGKRLLAQLADATVEIGGRLIHAGRRIVAFILETLQAVPNTTFGVVVALTVAMLIAAIPLLGPLLSPLFTPLLVALGLTKGALQDVKEGGLRTRIATLEAEFRTLTA